MSEWLTDKEKRILFSALTREKEICAKVDKDIEPREPYEQTLKSVCESLEHKFYYDRLFKQMECQIRAETIDEFYKVIEPYIQDINSNEVWSHSDNEKMMFDWLKAWKISLYRDLEQLKENK